MVGPPNKSIKSGEDFMSLIDSCYEIKFGTKDKTVEQEEFLAQGVKTIRETLEASTSSRDISFGNTRTSTQINWGKCLGVLLEDGPDSLNAIKILTERFSVGGGLFQSATF